MANTIESKHLSDAQKDVLALLAKESSLDRTAWSGAGKFPTRTLQVLERLGLARPNKAGTIYTISAAGEKLAASLDG